MWDKVKYLVIMGCIFGGLFILIGTAGASDLNQIGFEKLTIQSCIGLLLLIAGTIGLKIGGYENE